MSSLVGRSVGGEDGEFRATDVGICPLSDRMDRSDRSDYNAAVEDVIVRRRQHHHRGGHLSGALDVLCDPKYRPDPVQGLRLPPTAGR